MSKLTALLLGALVLVAALVLAAAAPARAADRPGPEHFQINPADGEGLVVTGLLERRFASQHGRLFLRVHLWSPDYEATYFLRPCHASAPVHRRCYWNARARVGGGTSYAVLLGERYVLPARLLRGAAS